MADEKGSEVRLTDAWDWQTRVLHWTNAILVLSLVLLMLVKSGMGAIGIDKALRRPVKELHAYIGLLFMITLSLRVIWGFIGNKYALWTDIFPVTKEQRAAIGQSLRWYLSGFKGSPARAVGHDPLASLVYIALFAVLISQAATGFILSGLEFKMFPATLLTGGLGEGAAEALAGGLEEVHEFGMLFMFFFIFAHLGGLVVHEVKERTGLFSSMIHGKKYFPKDKN